MKHKTKKLKKLKKLKRQTKKNKKGGEMNTQGTTATIYMNPRLLCSGETLTPEMYNEVSKCSATESRLVELEMLRIKILQDHEVDLNIVQNYLVLPLKTCEINEDNLNEITYSEHNSGAKSPYTEKYFTSTNGKHRGNTQLKKAMANKYEMIVYPRLKQNFKECINNANNLNEILELCLKLDNVYEGIKYLNAHNVKHGEIDALNVMETFDGKIKMIDLGTFGSVDIKDSVQDFRHLLDLLYGTIYNQYMIVSSNFKFNKRLNPIKYFFLFSNVYRINLGSIQYIYKENTVDNLKKIIEDTFNKFYLILKGELRENEPIEYKEYKKSLENLEIEKKYFFGDDFQGKHLNDKIIQEVLFHTCNLDFVDFSNSNLKYVYFPHSSLDDINISNCNLKYVRCPHTSLKNAKFSNSILNNVDFSHAFLENIHFSNCTLNNVNFSDASLKNINFSNHTLNNVDFSHASLVDVDFSGATFNNVKFVKANLLRCTIDEKNRELSGIDDADY